MTKVTVNPETATEQVLAKAAQTVTVTDARGRKITLKKPSVLAQFRIVEVAGASAANTTFMGMVMPLIFVCEIDGAPITQPLNRLQLDALIQLLDDEGCEAAMDAVGKNWGQPDPDADKAAIKK